MLTIFLLLLLSQTHAVIGNYNIDCLPSPGLPVPLGDCLDALTKIPPATIHRDDFLRPFTFRAGHCAIAVARDPPDSTLHPPQNVVDAMLNIVWPDIKHIAQNVVRKCVREEMGMAGMCLGNNLIEGRWYGYSVKVNYSWQAPPARLLGISPPGSGRLSPPGSPPRWPPGPGTSMPGSPRGAPPKGGGGEEWKHWLV